MLAIKSGNHAYWLFQARLQGGASRCNAPRCVGDVRRYCPWAMRPAQFNKRPVGVPASHLRNMLCDKWPDFSQMGG
jgi:hypothetical protein